LLLTTQAMSLQLIQRMYSTHTPLLRTAIKNLSETTKNGLGISTHQQLKL
jgi:hypothetical protein